MDRNYYNQKRAQEHQREISQELATGHLLNQSIRKLTNFIFVSVYAKEDPNHKIPDQSG